MDPVRHGREYAVGVVVIVDGQSELFEIVAALHAGGGLADLLHRGQQETDEDGNDGDHHQELDQRETSAYATEEHGGPPKQRGTREGIEMTLPDGGPGAKQKGTDARVARWSAPQRILYSD